MSIIPCNHDADQELAEKVARARDLGYDVIAECVDFHGDLEGWTVEDLRKEANQGYVKP